MPAPEILQAGIPEDQRIAASRPLPGIQPLDGTDWLTVDDAFGAQMQERARLLQERRSDVIQMRPEAEQAARELLDEVLALLKARGDFTVTPRSVTRPDGQTVALDATDPLGTLARLISEDLCILQKSEDAHVLTAAVLCFPASWTLSEKIGKPLIGLHRPVKSYDPDLAQRVQRLFDGVRLGRPIWRANLLRYSDPSLYQPRREGEEKPSEKGDAVFERSERQVIWRLPKTNAVVFTIHTTVVAAGSLGHPH